jgi:hypothetical protein
MKFRRTKNSVVFWASAIVFIAGLIFAMLISVEGAKKFTDPWGILLLSGMFTCLFVAFSGTALCGITYPHRSKKVLITVSLATGVGLIFFGMWVYGEKQRFSNLDVVQTTAIIKNFSGRHKHRRAHYIYTDQAGIQHTGTDSVNNGASLVRMRKNADWPVNYLRKDPSVSRIIEYDDTQAYMVKGFFILLGFFLMTYAPLKIARSTKIEKNQQNSRLP